ncbi:MAG: hypothetical protein KatS3mg111_0704 [Pirellulaceae bacterium]|nr:MAG: hypothetical protein KatS3mg111_0704 [Pirellulaceae bacterium]
MRGMVVKCQDVLFVPSVLRSPCSQDEPGRVGELGSRANAADEVATMGISSTVRSLQDGCEPLHQRLNLVPKRPTAAPAVVVGAVR